MSGHYKSAGSWQELKNGYGKLSGAWSRILKGYIKEGGIWKLVFDYLRISTPFAQIGDIIISGETKLTDSGGGNQYDLLACDGSTISAITYPLLVAELGNTTLPNIADETGSPFPYKIVGDLT